MPNKFVPPQTTTTTRTAAIPLDGEILYDTDEKKLYYGDGTTVGGKAIGSPTVTDNVFRIQDNSDNTKQLAFETSSITTGTTRTLTVPDSNGTVLSTDTLTDKALYYYDASSKLFKPVGVGTVGQTLIAQPSSNPPYQWATPSGGREVLTANRTYYVRADGSDSNNGLTDTSGGAFLTIQKAIDVVSQLDQSIYTATIQVQNGTWTQNLTLPYTLGKCVLKGDTSTPSNCTINTSGNAITVTGDKWKIEGFTVIGANQGIRVDGGVIELGVIRFSGSGATGLRVFNNGRFFINTSAPPALTFTGTYGGSAMQISNSTLDLFGVPFTVTGLTCVDFIRCEDTAVARLTTATFTGSFTGTRYTVTSNAILNTGGQATTWIPGSVAGTTSTGGQYL